MDGDRTRVVDSQHRSRKTWTPKWTPRERQRFGRGRTKPRRMPRLREVGATGFERATFRPPARMSNAAVRRTPSTECPRQPEPEDAGLRRRGRRLWGRAGQGDPRRGQAPRHRLSCPGGGGLGSHRKRSDQGRRPRCNGPHRAHPRARVRTAEAVRSSSSGAEAPSPAAISTCPGSTSMTRSA
jgi:hypothetical protein